jgi:hypothetical protein
MFELGPLCFFVPRLTLLRNNALLEYGVLAQFYATNFHEKWILRRASRETETPNVTMLADLARSYGNIMRIRPFPIDKETLIALAWRCCCLWFQLSLPSIHSRLSLRG